MELETIAALIGLISVLGGGIFTAAKIRGKIDDSAKDIIAMMDRLDKHETRLDSYEAIAEMVKSFGTNVNAKFEHIAELMRLHTEGNKQQFDDLKTSIREVKNDVQSVRNHQ